MFESRKLVIEKNIPLLKCNDCCYCILCSKYYRSISRAQPCCCAAPGRWILSDAWYPRAFHQSHQSDTGASVSFELSKSSFTCQVQLPQWVLNYSNDGWKKLPYSMILARYHVSSILYTQNQCQKQIGRPSSFQF